MHTLAYCKCIIKNIKKISYRIMNLFKRGIIYKTYDFVKSYIRYRKTRNAIKDVFYGEDFPMVIKKYLNVDLDKDWLGRLYGVINPNVDIKGNLNVNNVIIEIDGNNTNTDEYVKTWIYKQLSMMGQLFNMRNLYTNINMEIEHVGPEDQDNYLIVFDIVDREIMTSSFKKFMKTLTTYVVIGVSVLGILMLTHII